MYFIVENILSITTKLDLSREFILMQSSPPFDDRRELFWSQTFDQSYLTLPASIKIQLAWSINQSIFAENSESRELLNSSTIQLTTNAVSVSVCLCLCLRLRLCSSPLPFVSSILYLLIYFCKWFPLALA